MSERVVGIDLGTTNSAVAVVGNGSPSLLAVGGETIVPSVVGIGPSGDVLVGTPARNQWVAAPESTVRSIKRRMGRPDTVRMAGKDYRPQEVSAFILRRLREAATEALGEPVDRAVITVPAYFTEVQRQATIEAGEIAGWRVERIINEPTAAALAYGVGRDEDRKMLVYDLGGGTFDVSVVEMSGGVIDVRSTAGDNQLGGDDFDEMLASVLAVDFAEEHGVDVREDPRAWPRVLRAAEEAKIRLSTEPFALVSLEFLSNAGGRPRHLRREVAREELEELVAASLERTLQMMDMALADAELEASEIDIVLLVGGATRMPLVAEMVGAHLGREPHREIDPDAVVALGAAVQAAIVAGEPVDAVLVDVTPLSLGIAVADVTRDGRLVDDIFAKLIARNTTIPAVYTKTFSTVFPGQLVIKVQVYQGESAVASANTLLGEFDVEDLESNTPMGLSEVLVRFAIDVNGILEVTATERGTSNQVSARLRATRQRMSPEEIETSRRRLDEAGVLASEIDADELDEVRDPGTSALLDRAAESLERSDLDPEEAARIAGVCDAIRAAIRAGDPLLAEEFCVELIDRLIGVES